MSAQTSGEADCVVHGSCLCRTVCWEARTPFFNMSHCHCSMCRKAHGAPFATYVGAKAEGFAFTHGHGAIARYRSSATTERCFCSHCGSIVPDAPHGESVYMPAGCLDEDPGARAIAHIFTAAKAAWYTIADTLPQHAEYPPGWSMPAVPSEPLAFAPTTPSDVVGSCLCGRVAYEVVGGASADNSPWIAVYNCHCSRCRKARAAAHTTNGFVDPARFRFLQGEDNLGLYKVPDAERFTQAFCLTCSSAMPRVRPERIAIPVASLDTTPAFPALRHIFVASKAPWFEIADTLQQSAQYAK